MADPQTSLPLVPSSIAAAHAKISAYVYKTPVLTCKTLDRIASSRSVASAIEGKDNLQPSETGAEQSADAEDTPRFRLFFKCENFQRIGAFKPRGAFYALLRLIEEQGEDEVRRRGVIAHSSGNFAQGLSLAASQLSIPAHIVMPTISTPSKIAGTRANTPFVYFSGSTAAEREAKVKEIQARTGSFLVPPYDHPDIILGQGTVGLELDQQYREMTHHSGGGNGSDKGKFGLDLVVSPLGGGGLTGGIAVHFADQQTMVIGAEPSFQGANDAQLGLYSDPPKRIESVKTLTIADGLRTPLGVHNWNLFTSTIMPPSPAPAQETDSQHQKLKGKTTKTKVLESVYSVSETEIKSALKLIMERMKLFVEPSSAVPLAVILFNNDFRRWAAQEQKKRGDDVWDVGVIISGGNTTIEALIGIFTTSDEEKNGKEVKREEERAEGKVGLDGKKVAENIAG